MEWLSSALEYLRGANLAATAFRLFLAMLFGGIIGLERGRRRRPAGFRTHILVCMGAALAMSISQYVAVTLGQTTDVSRLGAQVINGIGFLGAGTIIVTGKQEVKGLTTAAGLWASACMGLAIGAGFYECVFLAFLLIFLCIRFLPYLETAVVERARNMNIYVEFTSMDDVGRIIGQIKAQNAQIYEVDITRGKESRAQQPSAVFSIRLNHRRAHEQVLTAIAELETITMIDEV